jgi:hypothetical protein
VAPISYERVTFVDGSRKARVYLRVTRDSPRFLSGIEVDKQGEEIEPHGYSQRIRLIDKRAIVSRREYVMDLHYGELVPARKGTRRY